MRADMADEGARWLGQALRDLADAEYNRSGGRHNVACFLAQQASEKALKGYLYAQGVEAPRGHSVRELVAAASEFAKPFDELAKKGSDLDKFYIPTRYPNGLPGGLPSEAFDEADSERALGDARAVIGMVEGSLK